MWLNFLHFRARIHEIHSQRKRQPQINVNPRLSNSGIPVFPNKWPVANRLYRIRCALRFSRGHCSAYGFLAGGHFTDGERMPSPAAQVGFIPGRVSNGKYRWNGMTGTVPGDVSLEDTFVLWCFFGFNCEFFLSLLPLRSDEFERIPWFRGWTRRRQWWTTFLAASQANKWETSSQASFQTSRWRYVWYIITSHVHNHSSLPYFFLAALDTWFLAHKVPRTTPSRRWWKQWTPPPAFCSRSWTSPNRISWNNRRQGTLWSQRPKSDPL